MLAYWVIDRHGNTFGVYRSRTVAEKMVADYPKLQLRIVRK